MKKIFFLSILFILLGANAVYAQKEEIRDYGNYIDFENYNIYELSGAKLAKFTENPSFDTLEKICMGSYSCVRYIRGDNVSVLSKLSMGKDGNSGLMTSQLQYNEENMKYISRNNMNKLLYEKGINDTINTVTMIEVGWCDGDASPYIVWINTMSNKNYFLVYDEPVYWSENYKRKNFSKFEDLEFIDYEEFKNRYIWKTGSLYINNNLIEDTINPIFLRYIFRIPVRGLLEGLGYEVTWDGEHQAILVSKNNHTKAILLNTDENLINGRVDSYPDNIEQVLPYPAMYFNINNSLYISGYGYLKNILDSLGEYYNTYEVDFDNRSIFICID